MNNGYHKQEGINCALWQEEFWSLSALRKKIQNPLNDIADGLYPVYHQFSFSPNCILKSWKKPYRSHGLTSYPLEETLSQHLTACKHRLA